MVTVAIGLKLSKSAHDWGDQPKSAHGWSGWVGGVGWGGTEPKNAHVWRGGALWKGVEVVGVGAQKVLMSGEISQKVLMPGGGWGG